jgi:hypothetical protein
VHAHDDEMSHQAHYRLLQDVLTENILGLTRHRVAELTREQKMRQPCGSEGRECFSRVFVASFFTTCNDRRCDVAFSALASAFFYGGEHGASRHSSLRQDSDIASVPFPIACGCSEGEPRTS